MDTLQDQLQRALGSAYRVEREIGAGGMSTVFAAVEASLGRRVAIKVLQPELVAELSTDRFAREVRLAASLQQANIVPLLSAGEAGGFSYYTMEKRRR
jgi:serine/threonine-protein kinase